MQSKEEELSNLQSEIMMKTNQNQQLSKQNASLTKHLNSLKEKEKAVSMMMFIAMYKYVHILYCTHSWPGSYYLHTIVLAV